MIGATVVSIDIDPRATTASNREGEEHGANMEMQRVERPSLSLLLSLSHSFSPSLNGKYYRYFAKTAALKEERFFAKQFSAERANSDRSVQL